VFSTPWWAGFVVAGVCILWRRYDVVK
jgi:hypothetical protein